MKELLNKTDKTEWIAIGLFKVSIYICWYLIAIIFNFYLQDELTDTKLILLVLALVITYIIRNFFKILYKKGANDSYYHIKHSIEMYYFNKLKNISYEKLEKINKEELSNKILEVSYNYTRIISDIFEYMIPAGIGLFMVFIKLLDINKAFGIIAFLVLIAILIYSYYNLHDDEIVVTNYNDLLKDFINKIHTIKKLNVFTYCVNKLNKERENDICILKNNDTINDIKFTNFIFIYISIIFIFSFIFVRSTITRLGTIIFFSIIIIKLQDLLFHINPAIKNMFISTKNKTLLEEYFKDEKEVNVNNTWKKISIIDGVVNYNETTKDIKIPSFELLRKDHISILGETGQGKSTLLNILSGSFKLDKGSILFDGNESNDMVDAIYISKEVDILNVSLKDNLIFNSYITDEEILGLINEIGLNDWLKTLPNGLDEIITSNIEDSIKEKINILRTIISNKEIIFLDNPIMALDSDSENQVAKMMKKYYKDKTYIIISKKTILTNLCKKHYFIKNHTLLEKEPLL